jgi:hypothetical protein
MEQTVAADRDSYENGQAERGRDREREREKQFLSDRRDSCAWLAFPGICCAAVDAKMERTEKGRREIQIIFHQGHEFTM